MSVVETVAHAAERVGEKEYPVTITHRVGLQRWGPEGSDPVLVDAVTLIDAGGRGVSRCVTRHGDDTPEERAAGRKHIQDIISEIMAEQGIWQYGDFPEKKNCPGQTI